MIRQMRHLRPSAEFRQTWQYQNLHYVTASHLAPSLTGVRFIDYVQRNIWDPLGMKNSFYNISEARATGRLADGFVKVGRNMTECAIRMKDSTSDAMKNRKLDKSCLGKTKSIGWFIAGDGEAHAGPGGVITSANDMVSFQAQPDLLTIRSAPTVDNAICFPGNLVTNPPAKWSISQHQRVHHPLRGDRACHTGVYGTNRYFSLA